MKAGSNEWVSRRTWSLIITENCELTFMNFDVFSAHYRFNRNDAFPVTSALCNGIVGQDPEINLI